jgi:hypothetical protein
MGYPIIQCLGPFEIVGALHFACSLFVPEGDAFAQRGF